MPPSCGSVQAAAVPHVRGGVEAAAVPRVWGLACAVRDAPGGVRRVVCHLCVLGVVPTLCLTVV